MILRVRSASTAVRLSVDGSEPLSSLETKIRGAFALQGRTSVYLDEERKHPVRFSDAPVSSLALASGSFLFVEGAAECGGGEAVLDESIRKTSGKISRPRQRECAHPEHGMCSHCMPLEPFDETHHRALGIKHLSFHAYLRKLGLEAELGKRPARTAPLEAPQLVRPRDCRWHAANGMCAKCQPPALVLQRQEYRAVDHVEFSTSALIDDLLSYWRRTSHQRFAFLVGRYAAYDGVPLGVKAVVECVWEPAQDCSVDGFELLDDGGVDRVFSMLGLEAVGLIFTDLQADAEGRMLWKRNPDRYFVTSHEVAWCSRYQARHPMRCSHASGGFFSSRFVSCVLSGSQEGGIAPFAFQISDAGVAMLESGVAAAHLADQPQSLRVAESTRERFVPEVAFRQRNEYGAEVQQAASPHFPADYLVVSVTHGFPQCERSLFAGNLRRFPSVSRPEVDEAVTLQTLSAHLAELSLERFSNTNVLLFISSLASVEDGDLRVLCQAVASQCNERLSEFLSSKSWLSVAVAMADHKAEAAGLAEGWTCSRCTFENPRAQPRDACEMCGLPQ